MPFFGVIDVFNLCLTRLPDSSDSRDIVSLESKHEVKGFPYQENDQLHAPYAALSYVWGGDQVHKTTTAKILHLRGPGSLETVLRHYPQVIKDAIDLTRRLGIRYLWVDSCCIVQDSERVWKRNAQHMDLIYGNAAVTICAADGSRADDGLYAMDPKTRSMDRLVRVVAPGVELMISRLAETTISSTVWNTRAWTFQERLLSKRCLIFAKGRVFFQCPSSTMLEDVIAEPKGEGWSLDLVNVPSQLSRDLKSRPFYVYTQCIGLYSSRKLTKQEDVLSAFTGVENMLSLYLNGPLAFGLPTSHFDLALLWEPLDPAKRRWVTESEQQGRKRSEFPSWSWCGWYDAKIVYKTELMRDIESHVHAWLTDHTWITWFIRDGNGYLRPLWNPLRFGMTDEHKETDARWEGYAQADTGNVGFVLRPHHDREESESEAASTASAHRRRSPSPQRVVKMITRPRDGNASAPQPDYYNRDDYGHNYYHTVKDAQTSYPQHARGVYGNDSYQAPPYNYGGHPYPGHYPPDYDYRRRQHQHHDFSRPRQRHNDNRSDVGDAAFAELPIPRPDYQNDQGRGNRSSQRGKHTDRFWITTPESPYTVKTTEYQAQPDKEFPDYPILQFWTWSAHLRIARAASETSVQHDKPALHQYDIHDEAGDWCGSILLQSDWVAEWEKDNEESIEGSKHEFLALSDAKRFTSKECETWTYYIPKEREQSEWDLYYVLLVSRNRLFWHRVALGKVFKAAFDNGAPSKNWKEIVLA
ncbi:Hypothetical protein D9617_10g073450 [Elsinoe fawcettii]|nr:Hypothetical protein D9617_10g073450 [Elsinoe fawcettii]